MQFKLDENLPRSLVAMFTSAGHDAVSTFDQGLVGEPDSRIASVCRNEGRALVTLDGGFADIRAYPPADHPGIIVLRLRQQGVPYIRAMASRLLRLMAERPVARTLWVVEDDRVRFRQ